MLDKSNDLRNSAISIKVALVSFDSLGDSLLYLLLAHNLKINGYDVTYFGNVGYQLRPWLPRLNIKPKLSMDTLQNDLSEYQLVIMSPAQEMRDRFEIDSHYLDHIKSQYLLICQHAPEYWEYDHNSSLLKRLSPEVFASIKSIINAGGSIRYRCFKNESVVDILCDYMREKMKLPIIERYVDLQPLANLEFRKHRNRIIVSPDSAGPIEKNWGEKQFVALCRKFRVSGYDPIIVVAPQNYQYWKKLTNGEFSMPMFDDLGKLASYIYESCILIANDSGNGHLASFLGVPTVTIYKKANPYFHWRPDWTKNNNVVVYPKFIIKLPWMRLWKPFLTVNTVHKVALGEVQKNIQNT